MFVRMRRGAFLCGRITLRSTTVAAPADRFRSATPPLRADVSYTSGPHQSVELVVEGLVALGGGVIEIVQEDCRDAERVPSGEQPRCRTENGDDS